MVESLQEDCKDYPNTWPSALHPSYHYFPAPLAHVAGVPQVVEEFLRALRTIVVIAHVQSAQPKITNLKCLLLLVSFQASNRDDKHHSYDRIANLPLIA